MRFLLAALLFLPAAALACPDDPRLLAFSCAQPVSVHLHALEQGEVAPETPPDTLVVTGTYSSGDRYGIEGLAIVSGRVVSSRFQGWDGLAIFSPAGEVSLHNVVRVPLGATTFNLRDTRQRETFVSQAEAAGLSVIQSHLLISDGRLDVRDIPDQPRYRRRILFSTEAGDVGTFDTSPAALTLFDAATALEELARPVMALNLDMGAYDYCSRNDKGKLQDCGLLQRDRTDVLTNILTIRYLPQQQNGPSDPL